MSKKHMRRCSCALLIKEQNKRFKSDNFYPLEQLKLGSRSLPISAKIQGLMLLLYLLVVQPLGRAIWSSSKLNTHPTSCYPIILCLSIYLKVALTHMQQEVCTRKFSIVLLVKVKTCKQSKCPSIEELGKLVHS